MPVEYPLNVAGQIINFSTLALEADNFKNKFSINGQPALGSRFYEVVSAATYTIMTDSLAAAISTRSDFEYFAGIRVYYGIKNNAFMFLYVPVIMDLRGSVLPATDIFSVTPSGIDFAISIFDKDGNLIPFNDAITYVTAYRNNVRIIRTAGGALTNFINEDSRNGDGKASMVPCSEIALLGGVDPYYVTACARQYMGAGTHKHFIAFSKTDPNVAIPGPVAAANFANLCPPNCPVVEVKNKIIVDKFISVG